MLGDRWGVTPAETEMTFGCDAMVVAPRLQAWRGVSVDAPPEHVWRWVRQVRLAPYSYDWIDNGGRRSPRELSRLADPVVGDPFTTTIGGRAGRVLAVEPGRELTATIMGAVMSYLVVPNGSGSRLLLKIVARAREPLATALCVGDLVMARRQLLNLKRLAEASAASPGHDLV